MAYVLACGSSKIHIDEEDAENRGLTLAVDCAVDECFYEIKDFVDNSFGG